MLKEVAKVVALFMEFLTTEEVSEEHLFSEVRRVKAVIRVGANKPASPAIVGLGSAAAPVRSSADQVPNLPLPIAQEVTVMFPGGPSSSAPEEVTNFLKGRGIEAKVCWFDHRRETLIMRVELAARPGHAFLIPIQTGIIWPSSRNYFVSSRGRNVTWSSVDRLVRMTELDGDDGDNIVVMGEVS